MTAPPERFKIGGVQYPVTGASDEPTTAGVSVAASLDPGSYFLLRYFERVLNWALKDALLTVFPAAGAGGPTSGAAVQQTTTIDPLIWLQGNTWRWPLLALYPVGDDPVRPRTARWDQVATNYKLAYLLPPMTADQAERGFALLMAARRVLMLATEHFGADPIDGGTNPLIAAGVCELRFGRAEYGVLQREDGAQSYPSLVADISVDYREEADDLAGVADAFSLLTVDATDPADVIGTDAAAFTVTARSDVG